MEPPTVLVEGESDRRALEVLAGRLDVRLPRPIVLHGITNLRAELARGAGPYAVLHDRRETAWVDRVVERSGREVATYVCDADLEDELIRAVGVPGVLAAVESQHERPSYERMAQQVAQRDRTDHERLHRWLGARSGHKLTYAGLLAEAVDLDAAPRPLHDLLTDLRGHGG